MGTLKEMLLASAEADKAKALLTLELLNNKAVGIWDHSTEDFYKTDFAGTLFPLKTNYIVICNIGNELSEYIYQRVLDSQHPGYSFLPQQRVYATKPHGHLRRTTKLDPVAEFFLYDVVYRNKGIFRPEVSANRRSFGYRFTEGKRKSSFCIGKSFSFL